jgi:thiosulfate/3-mercaptopyruvate sulfurtransferase
LESTVRDCIGTNLRVTQGWNPSTLESTLSRTGNASMPTTLVDVATLSAHLNDPNWLIVDCRFDLANPTAGERAYASGHIPGAVYAHLDRDLSSPITPTTGRHPLPDAQDFAATLSRWGVTANTQVIAYDADNGMYAARLWWLLRWVGHDAAAVLDGGFKAWTGSGHPTASASARRPPSTFVVRPNRTMWVDASEVARAVADPAWRVLDARAPERYRGVVEPLDTAAGHVPGAINHPFATDLSGDGRFAGPQELKMRFDASQAGVADERTIAMCGSGVTACHLLLAMEVAGKRGAKLYSGSWSEWIRDPMRPIAKN